MDTLEGNKLIAEFMGWSNIQNFDENIPENWIFPFPNREFNEEEKNRPVDVRLFNYHTSWDWLMPVVERIGKKGIEVTINSTFVRINTYKLKKEDQSFHYTCYHGGMILNTWNSVVEFIKWYNTKKEAECIEGEEVINLLNGKRYPFTKDLADELHWPVRLTKTKNKKE